MCYGHGERLLRAWPQKSSQSSWRPLISVERTRASQTQGSSKSQGPEMEGESPCPTDGELLKSRNWNIHLCIPRVQKCQGPLGVSVPPDDVSGEVSGMIRGSIWLGWRGDTESSREQRSPIMESLEGQGQTFILNSKDKGNGCIKLGRVPQQNIPSSENGGSMRHS